MYLFCCSLLAWSRVVLPLTVEEVTSNEMHPVCVSITNNWTLLHTVPNWTTMECGWSFQKWNRRRWRRRSGCKPAIWELPSAWWSVQQRPVHQENLSPRHQSPSTSSPGNAEGCPCSSWRSVERLSILQNCYHGNNHFWQRNQQFIHLTLCVSISLDRILTTWRMDSSWPLKLCTRLIVELRRTFINCHRSNWSSAKSFGLTLPTILVL